MGLTRSIQWTPSAANGLEMRWLVHGPDGCVQFSVNTYWTTSTTSNTLVDVLSRRPPYAKDVGHHWHTPTYNGESRMDSCDLINNPDGCYYDGSGLHADTLFATLIREGDAAVWTELETYYEQCRQGAAEAAAERQSWYGEAFAQHATT